MDQNNEERLRIWVCHACGKTAEKHENFGDESCYLKAVECWADSLVYGKNGLVERAKAVIDWPHLDSALEEKNDL